MTCKIIIDSELCKGCGLCLEVCPKKCIRISADSNKRGYYPARFNGQDCVGCLACALICPEAVIEVQKSQSMPIVEIKTKSVAKQKENL